tara:strand:- start:5373 stop:6119 length:747 start_codon:yes stop_codon:yes gene_type:complete
MIKKNSFFLNKILKTPLLQNILYVCLGRTMSNILKIQSHILKGLVFVHEICEKNNITYYLIGGSALGAQRHSGFIPWDDDADIGVKRDDYIKLIAILKLTNNKKYFLQNTDIDTEFYKGYRKLSVNGTIYKDKYYRDSKIHHGISLDIFPLLILNKKGLFNISKKILKSNNKIPKVKSYVNFYGRYKFNKEINSMETLGKAKLKKFKNSWLLAPEYINDYLFNLYGDYMELSPLNSREAHSPFKIKIN